MWQLKASPCGDHRIHFLHVHVREAPGAFITLPAAIVDLRNHSGSRAWMFPFVAAMDAVGGMRMEVIEKGRDNLSPKRGIRFASCVQTAYRTASKTSRASLFPISQKRIESSSRIGSLMFIKPYSLKLTY
jgi:hypothetical protein